MLESYIKKRLKEKEILLMTHIVMGYPSFEESFKIVEQMVYAGVDLMELQIPFSEPMADGPVILHANQKSLAHGTKVDRCLEFAKKVSKTFNIPFLFMSYYNILYKYGLKEFTSFMKDINLYGAIVPDLPHEEAKDYLNAMEENSLDPIMLFSPNTPKERLKIIASHARGFIYCVARKGVTGSNTNFSNEFEIYVSRCRKATDLPLAIGFGVKEKKDIDFLKGKADIAIIGTKIIQLVEQSGIASIKGFIESLTH